MDVAPEDSQMSLQKSWTLRQPSSKAVHVLLLLLILYATVRSLVAASTSGFWYDEILTSAVSAQPSMKAVWAALATAVDGQPPGYYLVERAARVAIKNLEVALRLPSVLTFPCTLFCVFVYVKRRGGEVVAFLCAALLLSTILFQRYAAEARPYSLVVACFAFALVCYQNLPSIFWTAMLGISLIFAQSFHHYSLFAMVPFGLAEAVFLFTTHRFRWGVWFALVLGPMPLLFFYPLLAQLKAYLGVHFQVHYTYSSIPSTYGDFFLVDSAYGAALGAICIAGVLSLYFWPQRTDTTAAALRNADLVEGTLLLSLVGLPFTAFGFVRLMHGGMRSAYLIPAILGVSLAVACALSRSRPLAVALFAVFLMFDVGLREYKFWQSAHTLRLVTPAAQLEQFLRATGYDNTELPVVVASGMIYTPLAYYASGSLAKRLFYLTDEEKQLYFQGTDTFDKNVKVLQNYTPLQIRDYTEWTKSHPVFLLYGEDPGYGNTWLAQYLSREGYSVEALAVDPPRRLFLVNMGVTIQGDSASHGY
jgi:hypothetical protein